MQRLSCTPFFLLFLSPLPTQPISQPISPQYPPSANTTQPFTGHALFLTGATLAYLAWTCIGYLATGHWAYIFTNPRVFGARAIAFNVIVLLSLVLAAFMLVTSLHLLRDRLCRKVEQVRRERMDREERE